MATHDIPGSFSVDDDEMMGPVWSKYLIINITTHEIPGSFYATNDKMRGLCDINTW